MQAARIGADRIACAADVAAAAHVVGVQNVEAVHLPARSVCRDGAGGLSAKELRTGLQIQKLLLGKGGPLLHDLVPDPDHRADVRGLERSHFYVHVPNFPSDA